MSTKAQRCARRLCYPALTKLHLLLTHYSKDAATNPRGIPYAPFVDKVEDYVSSRAEVDGTMKSFQEMISYNQHAREFAVQLLIMS